MMLALSEQVQLSLIVAFFGFMTTIATGVMAYFQAKNSNATEKVIKLTEQQTETLDKTHTAVNTNHQEQAKKLEVMYAEITRLNREVLDLSVEKATAVQEVKSVKEITSGQSGIGIASAPVSFDGAVPAGAVVVIPKQVLPVKKEGK